MRYFSMFSGIGGFEYGIEQAYSRLARKRKCNSGSSRRRKKVNGERTCVSQTNGDMHDNVRSESTEGNIECVGYSEINKYASAIYRYHYPNHKNYGDATEIDVSELPDFELLVGGFPCQAFSIAGKRQGFKDTSGTLFFDVARVLESKRPEWVVLENVKGLLNHDSGKTISRIYEVLTELGYTVGWEVVNSCKFGVPQNRERIFIVGHLTEAGGRTGEILPVGEGEKEDNEKNLQQSDNDIAGTLNTKNNSGQLSVDKGTVLVSGDLKDRDISTAIDANYHKGMDNHGQRTMVKSGTWRTHKDGRGFRELENSDISPCIPARAREDGSGQPVIKKESAIRRLTPTECERLQGFPDGWTAKGIMDGEEVDISDTQRYKALGNAVTVNVTEAICGKILSLNTN